MIFSGDLTERLDFYKIVETQSASGFKTTTEQFILSQRAIRLKNRENYAANANELFHVTELTFKMRNRKELDETNIVVYEGKKYRITSFDIYPTENELTIILAKINE